MTPQQVLNQSKAELKAYASASPEPMLEETFQQIWKTIRSGRFYAGQPRNALTSKCVALAKSALQLAEAAENESLLLDAWRMLAHTLMADEQYQEAIDYYARIIAAFERDGDYGQAARSRLGYVAALFHTGKYAEALDVAAVAGQWFRTENDALGYARLCTNIANIYHRLDDHQRSYEYHSEAVEAFKNASDRQGLAQGYLNLGNALASIDRFDEADSIYARAEQTSLELQLTDLRIQAAYNRSYLWFLRGRYSEALRSFDAARQHFDRNGSIRHSSLCDLDQAEIYLQLNLSQDAIALATKAARRFEAIHMQYERAKALTFAGVAHTQTQHFTDAMKAFEEAERIFAGEGNVHWTAMLRIYRADLLVLVGRLDEARELAREAMETFDRLNIASRKGLCLTLLGRIACISGDLESAEKYVTELSALIQGHDIPLAMFPYYTLCGDVAVRGGRKNEARNYYERASEVLEQARSKLHHDDLRLGLLKGRGEVYEHIVRLWLEDADPENSARNAYRWCERAKSRGLIELLSGHIPNIHSKADQAGLKKIVRLREELNAAYVRVKPEQAIPGSRAYGAIASKENELARTLREISDTDPEYISLQQTADVCVEDVQKSLPADAAVVEYFIAEGQVTAFVITPSAFKVFPNCCPVDRVYELQERLNFQLEKFLLSRDLVDTYADQILFATKRHLQELYSELFEPLAGFLRAEHLFIVGHDKLHFLPFHAFYDGGRYLIDRYTISYSPSASVLGYCASKEDVADSSPALFGISDENTRFIDDETIQLSRLFPDSRAFIGENARRATFSDEARSARFVHVAAHSLFRHDNPMFSGFKLADGWFTALDLFSIRCETNLVTLSGCSSGLSGIAGGDDLVGLIRGFLYAGARSLLVSLWQVDDRSACSLMRHFYTEWQKGRSKSAALRSAMIAIREQFPHPAFWAPFLLVGKP